MNSGHRIRKRTRGLSLLECILALAILGVALGIIGQHIRVGTRSAATARDLTTAQLLAESRMSELAAGAVPLEPVMLEPMPDAPEWLLTVEISPLDIEGLVAVRVVVTHNVPTRLDPTSFSLVRWMVDPAIDFAELEAELAEQDEAANDS